MVIKIHQSVSTQNALFYNDRKVMQHKATFYHSRNTPQINPFLGAKNARYRIFEEIEDRNSRVQKKGLHISVNPTIRDLVRLGDSGIRKEIDNLMKHLGYGDQPYLVYRHADIDRVHFHIISTRIDKQTGKKIKDNFEKEKVQKFIKDLEQTYKLTKDDPTEKINLKFTAYSKNLKQNLENLFAELNRMDFITNKEMYNDALRLFHIEIKQVHKGHLIFVTDGNGNPVRHPLKMSDFEERPRLHQIKGKTEKIELIEGHSVSKSENIMKNHRGNPRLLIDLLRLIPKYSNENNFMNRKKMIRNHRKGIKW
jgi:hypothetical protein